jgi:hypothetical protein
VRKDARGSVDIASARHQLLLHHRAVGHDVDRLADQVRHREHRLPSGVVESDRAVGGGAVDVGCATGGNGVRIGRDRQLRREAVIEDLDVAHRLRR